MRVSLLLLLLEVACSGLLVLLIFGIAELRSPVNKAFYLASQIAYQVAKFFQLSIALALLGNAWIRLASLRLSRLALRLWVLRLSRCRRCRRCRLLILHLLQSSFDAFQLLKHS